LIASPPQFKRWQIAPSAPKDLVTRFSNLPRLIVQMLYNRGITDPNEIERFLDLTPSIPNPLEPPKLKDLDIAVARLRRAIQQREPIAVYGDYDVDGVTATALLVETLTSISTARGFHPEVRAYIPDRVDEGYGLNPQALEKLREEGVRVVVTVDCGVRSVEEVTYGNQIGLDIIITDHHHTSDVIPPAVACINPKQPGCPYPFKDMSGVGLAFKLAQAMLIIEQRMNPAELPEVDSLLDLVALGTVADLVPLLDENRTLVVRGLARLNKPTRPGLIALMNVVGLKPGVINASTIGFGLGPRLNAAGRVESAMTAYQLLSTQDETEAARLALELDEQNRERQRLTRETQERAREMALTQNQDACLLFAAAPDFRAGVVGLAAARLSEEFYRPAIVVEQGEEESRGSCRSIPEFHITQALDQCADLLVRHGGHAAAAGFTVHNENLRLLADRLRAIASQQLSHVDLSPSLAIDCEWPIDALGQEALQALQRLEPCGYGNPTPVLCSRSVRVVDARTVGKEGSHLKLNLSGERSSWDAIAFRQSNHSQWLRPGMRIDVAYNLEENEWNGAKHLQLNVRDLHPSG